MNEPAASFEAVCVGETMAMVTPAQPEPLETAQSFAICAGGAESNVAMYLAGLGHRVAWVSRLGDDPLGKRVLRDISDCGVDTSFVQIDDSALTGAYFKDPSPDGTRVFYYRRGSAASLMSEDLLSIVLGQRPSLVHLTGITPALSQACDDMMTGLISELDTVGTTVSFDVNFREGLWPRPRAATRLMELAQQADIVFVGLDEGSALWDAQSPDELRALIDRPSVLLVKDGSSGVVVYHEQGRQFAPSLRLNVQEHVGAGDAFAAGWLSGWLRGLPHLQRLRLGHLLASLALSSTADHLALPYPLWLEAPLAVSEAEWAALDLPLPVDGYPPGGAGTRLGEG